jgi:hypothetical protein
MAFVLSFNFALQVLAAFVIFLFGYLAFMALLMTSLLIATGLYEGMKRVRAYTVRSATAPTSISSALEAPAHLPTMARQVPA